MPPLSPVVCCLDTVTNGEDRAGGYTLYPPTFRKMHVVRGGGCRFYFLRATANSDMFEKILVVCVGNICRSPTGERLLRERLPGRQVSSAGVSALVDKPADKVASEVAQQHGLSLEGHSARQLTRELCQDADLILVMEKGHISAVTAIDPGARGKTMLFGHWQGKSEVPDPYRLSREAYEHVYQLLVRCADGWAKKL